MSLYVLDTDCATLLLYGATEIGRQVAQLAGILVHALVRVDTHRPTRIRQPEGAARQHPVLQQMP